MTRPKMSPSSLLRSIYTCQCTVHGHILPSGQPLVMADKEEAPAFHHRHDRLLGRATRQTTRDKRPLRRRSEIHVSGAQMYNRPIEPLPTLPSRSVAGVWGVPDLESRLRHRFKLGNFLPGAFVNVVDAGHLTQRVSSASHRFPCVSSVPMALCTAAWPSMSCSVAQSPYVQAGACHMSWPCFLPKTPITAPVLRTDRTLFFLYPCDCSPSPRSSRHV